MSVVDLAHALAPDCKLEFVGIRPGEKLHEQMIGVEDAYYTFEYSEYYKILPVINEWSISPARIKNGVKVAKEFTYCSDNNTEWMTPGDLMAWVNKNRKFIGKI